MSQAPQAKYRKDYKAPSHHITDIDLTFDLYDNDTIVTAVSKVVQKGESTTLELDGEGLELRSVKVNGEDWSHHEVKETSLVLTDLPAEFALEIVTKIDPEAILPLKVYTNQVVHSVHNVKQKASAASLITWTAQTFLQNTQQK